MPKNSQKNSRSKIFSKFLGYYGPKTRGLSYLLRTTLYLNIICYFYVLNKRTFEVQLLNEPRAIWCTVFPELDVWSVKVTQKLSKRTRRIFSTELLSEKTRFVHDSKFDKYLRLHTRQSKIF